MFLSGVKRICMLGRARKRRKKRSHSTHVRVYSIASIVTCFCWLGVVLIFSFVKRNRSYLNKGGEKRRRRAVKCEISLSFFARSLNFRSPLSHFLPPTPPLSSFPNGKKNFGRKREPEWMRRGRRNEKWEGRFPARKLTFLKVRERKESQQERGKKGN